MRLPALLLCLIPSLIAAQALATTPPVQPVNDTVNAPLVSAIQGANSGDVITLAAGTFTVSAPIYVPTGVTITGVNPQGSAHLVFNLPGGDYGSYGFVLNGNDTNVTIENLDIHSSNGLIQMSNGSLYNGITITNNNLQYGGGQLSDGSDVYGISGTISSQNVNVTFNYFHDSPNSVRNWCFFFTKNSNFEYNIFYNIDDGGQLVDPVGTTNFNYNYGTYMHRMGQEVALQAGDVYNCIGNVFYDYVLPYNDTEGVSIVGISGAVTIANNFFEANIAPGSTWGQQSGLAAGGPNRFGYAIEATGNPGKIYGNTLIGAWAEDVSSDIANAQVYSNSVYGVALWGDFEGEPGPYGYGSIQLNPLFPNIIDNNVGDAPAPPASIVGAGPNYNGPIALTSVGSTGDPGNTGGGTTGGTGTTIPPTSIPPSAANNPPLPITGVVVTVQNSTNVTVSWISPNPDITSVQINIISTIGRQNFPPATATGDITSLGIGQLHPGWLIDFTVTAVGSNGQRYTSKVVTADLPGNSVAPWQGLLWGGIGTLQHNPYLN